MFQKKNYWSSFYYSLPVHLGTVFITRQGLVEQNKLIQKHRIAFLWTNTVTVSGMSVLRSWSWCVFCGELESLSFPRGRVPGWQEHRGSVPDVVAILIMPVSLVSPTVFVKASGAGGTKICVCDQELNWDGTARSAQVLLLPDQLVAKRTLSKTLQLFFFNFSLCENSLI